MCRVILLPNCHAYFVVIACRVSFFFLLFVVFVWERKKKGGGVMDLGNGDVFKSQYNEGISVFKRNKVTGFC